MDETGIHAIINPYLYERNRVAVTRAKILSVKSMLQNLDGVVNLRASAVHVLTLSNVACGHTIFIDEGKDEYRV